MNKLKAVIFSAAILGATLVPVAAANASPVVEKGSVVSAQKASTKYYYVCRRTASNGTVQTWGLWASEFVIINMQYQGWICRR